MFIKIHKSYRNVVALCDSEIMGKKFEEEKFQLDIKSSFYRGEEVTKEQAIMILKRQALEDATFNIVGKESIQAAVESGIIKKNEIATLSGIPFALILI